jgi:hypothetical protein
MCSIQDAFPDLNFNNSVNPQEQKISQAKSELLKMQEERGKMMNFQCSDVTTPYFLQNQPNMPHIAETTLAGDFSVPASTGCNCLPGQCTCNANKATEGYLNTASSFTPEVINDPTLLAEVTQQLDTTQDKGQQEQSAEMVQQLAEMVQRLDAKVNGLERKCNTRNSHDMLLFIVIVIFVILVVDTLMKN